MSERVWIDEDEWYPLCSIVAAARFAYEAEVPDGFTARWEAAYAEFSACQDVMREAIRPLPNPVPLPEPTDFVLDLDEPAVHFKAGDTLHYGDGNMLVVSVTGNSVRMRRSE